MTKEKKKGSLTILFVRQTIQFTEVNKIYIPCLAFRNKVKSCYSESVSIYLA